VQVNMENPAQSRRNFGLAGKPLAPILEVLVPILRRDGELDLTDAEAALLVATSAATIGVRNAIVVGTNVRGPANDHGCAARSSASRLPISHRNRTLSADERQRSNCAQR
jgi:hypothetical protein